MSLACYIQVLASKIYLMSFKTVSITPLHLIKAERIDSYCREKTS